MTKPNNADLLAAINLVNLRIDAINVRIDAISVRIDAIGDRLAKDDPA